MSKPIEARPPGEGSLPVGAWHKEGNRGHFTKTESLYLVVPGRLPGEIIQGVQLEAFTRISINHGYFSNGDRLTDREENGEHKYFITATQAPQSRIVLKESPAGEKNLYL